DVVAPGDLAFDRRDELAGRRLIEWWPFDQKIDHDAERLVVGGELPQLNITHGRWHRLASTTSMRRVTSGRFNRVGSTASASEHLVRQFHRARRARADPRKLRRG